ncbi:MAG: QueT transporter family protein [Halanaerobiaceae bacterium]
MKTKEITKVGLIAAIYVVLTLVFAPISYGHIQLRISEALTLLPFYLGYPAVLGLFIGVMLANIAGGFGLIDIIFGSLITLIAAVFTARARSLYTAGIYPVVFNALGVGLILFFLQGFRPISPVVDEITFFSRDIAHFINSFVNYLVYVFFVGIGQTGAVYFIGLPLMKLLNTKLDLENM